MSNKVLFAGIAALSISFNVSAGAIVQDSFDSLNQIDFFEPIGQSFTAQDTSAVFSLFIAPIVSTSPVSDLQFQLLSGDGLGGSVLLNQTLSPTLGYTGYFNFDLTSIPLTIGDLYTVAVSVPGASSYWGADFATGTNPYASGQAYFNDPFNLIPASQASSDWRFKVTPTEGSVPEPATIALIGLGFAGIGISRRRKVSR